MARMKQAKSKAIAKAKTGQFFDSLDKSLGGGKYLTSKPREQIKPKQYG